MSTARIMSVAIQQNNSFNVLPPSASPLSSTMTPSDSSYPSPSPTLSSPSPSPTISQNMAVTSAPKQQTPKKDSSDIARCVSPKLWNFIDQKEFCDMIEQDLGYDSEYEEEDDHDSASKLSPR